MSEFDALEQEVAKVLLNEIKQRAPKSTTKTSDLKDLAEAYALVAGRGDPNPESVGWAR